MGSRDKVKNIARLFGKLHGIFDELYLSIERAKTSCEVYGLLKSVYGFGNFLAYQVLVDLSYPLKCYKNQPLLPFSQNDWASAGPGAQRGIMMLLRPDHRANHLDVMRWLQMNQREEFDRLKLGFEFIRNPIALESLQTIATSFDFGDGLVWRQFLMW